MRNAHIPVKPNAAELRRSEQFLAPTPARPKLKLLDFKPITKNSLRGFASIELPIGLQISDIPVMVSAGKAWASLPSKPQLDRDGQPRRDLNGKVAYSPILQWNSRRLQDAFSESVLAVVREAHPDVLDDGGAP